MQDLWTHGFDWDSPLTDMFLNSWKSFQSQLDSCSEIRIPRWFGASSNSSWSLHGFSDLLRERMRLLFTMFLLRVILVLSLLKQEFPQ